MRIQVLFLFSFLFFVLPVSSQTDGLEKIKTAKSTIVRFKERTFYEDLKLPFKDIIVLDKRYDTSKVGYVGQGVIYKVIPSAWPDILSSYFKQNLDPSSTNTLVIVLKSFWLQRGIIDYLVHRKIVQKDIFGRSEFEGGVKENGGVSIADMDIYSKTDSIYQPLFRIDTVFMNATKVFRGENLDEFFFLPFDSLIRKMSKTDVPGLLQTRRKLSLPEVLAYYNKRFENPVLTEPTIKKGIYLTFDDFKKNQPDETPFNVKRGQITDELYKVNGNTEDIVADYWGYFDGEDLYIHCGYSVFKALRQQNTFEIYGAKYITVFHNNPQPGDIKLVGNGMQLKILQLNMDKGKLY